MKDQRTKPYSTRKLRELRAKALEVINPNVPAKYVEADAFKLFICSDSIVAVSYRVQGHLTWKTGETLTKAFSAYSKDGGKTWKMDTNNTFEPAEGKPTMIYFEQHDSPFPTIKL